MLAGQGLLPGEGQTLQEASRIHQPREALEPGKVPLMEETSALSSVWRGQTFQRELLLPGIRPRTSELGST